MICSAATGPERRMQNAGFNGNHHSLPMHSHPAALLDAKRQPTAAAKYPLFHQLKHFGQANGGDSTEKHGALFHLVK
jgi:hypothetical protein